jgi:hypothetical protein
MMWILKAKDLHLGPSADMLRLTRRILPIVVVAAAMSSLLSSLATGGGFLSYF